tara:strand:+ start:146 stop:496 length:351 start_codon:yes stop_codon:yes gene_type:complete
MILIKCPYCGEREQSEFTNGGEAHVIRPKDPDALSDKEWGQYVFYRSNPKGIFYERWVHTHGCRKWFNVVRDTSTDTILKIYKVTDNRPELTEFQSTLKSPSGEPIVGSGNFAVKK